MIWCIMTYIIAYVKTQKKLDLVSIMSNLQPNCCLKFDFKRWTNMHEAGGLSTTPNAARTISCKAWNSPADYPSSVARCDIKGSVSTVLNPIFSKKVQGQKHPGRWGIVEHQIPSIKVLFKTNTKGHTHPSIRLISKSKTQLVNKENKKWHSAQEPRTPQKYNPIERVGVQLRQYWMTLLLYVYTSYNRTHIMNAHTHI